MLFEKIENYENTDSTKTSAELCSELINARHSTTLRAARLLRVYISLLAKGNKEREPLDVNVFELASLLGYPEENAYADIFNCSDELASSCAQFTKLKQCKKRKVITSMRFLPWVGYVKHDGKGTITIKASEYMWPFLFAYSEYITQEQIDQMLRFESFYALRIYEIAIGAYTIDGKTEYEFEIPDLHRTLGFLKKKFDQEAFCKELVEPAIAEVNRMSDIQVMISYYVNEYGTNTAVFQVEHNTQP